jgi:hypothetical protein
MDTLNEIHLGFVWHKGFQGECSVKLFWASTKSLQNARLIVQQAGFVAV